MVSTISASPSPIGAAWAAGRWAGSRLILVDDIGRHDVTIGCADGGDVRAVVCLAS